MAKQHALLGSLLVLAPLVVGSAACVSRNPNWNNHWSFESVETSVRKHVFGHASSDENALRDAYYADYENIVKTFSRHVMNDNPDNPLLPHASTSDGFLRTSEDYELPPGGFQPTGN